MFCCRNHYHLILLLPLFLLWLSSFTHLSSLAQGRDIPKQERTHLDVRYEEEMKVMMRSLIGSRPPRCEVRCRDRKCDGGHCEAVQVPIDDPKHPQISRTNHHFITADLPPQVIAYSSRADSSENYKPMCWKCKCGSYIFNP
ncbi:unnamed protein product [Cuscuta epithymum]|uniref:Epidermal patterning factor-like protein n=1 Tax=Cuscuta epithymum TaxID=186058 RepID=A0AAV0EZH0_9ASTE|nr:unnamed protein product [Cuscuta epithymum]